MDPIASNHTWFTRWISGIKEPLIPEYEDTPLEPLDEEKGAELDRFIQQGTLSGVAIFDVVGSLSLSDGNQVLRFLAERGVPLDAIKNVLTEWKKVEEMQVSPKSLFLGPDPFAWKDAEPILLDEALLKRFAIWAESPEWKPTDLREKALDLFKSVGKPSLAAKGKISEQLFDVNGVSVANIYLLFGEWTKAWEEHWSKLLPILQAQMTGSRFTEPELEKKLNEIGVSKKVWGREFRNFTRHFGLKRIF